MVTEECYGQLKGRWRILLRKCESSTEKVRAATLACMVLHNVCLERRETMSKKLNLTIDPGTNQKRDRETIRELLQIKSCGTIRDPGNQANAIRDALSEKLFPEKEKSLAAHISSNSLLILSYNSPFL